TIAPGGLSDGSVGSSNAIASAQRIRRAAVTGIAARYTRPIAAVATASPNGLRRQAIKTPIIANKMKRFGGIREEKESQAPSIRAGAVSAARAPAPARSRSKN